MVAIVWAAAYLLGAVPFGYILSRHFYKTDIRRQGSGNIGATNVLRILGWRAALPVFLLDFAKGAVAVILARAFNSDEAVYLTAGFLAMVGHSFPVYLRFRGGKAAATGIGVMTVVSWPLTLALIAIAGLILVLTRYVSVASMSGSLAVPLLFLIFGYDLPYVLFGLAMALLVVARHHSNISRLLQGTESRLGKKG